MGKQVAARSQRKEAVGFSYRKRWDLPVIRVFRRLRILMADKDQSRQYMYLENFIQRLMIRRILFNIKTSEKKQIL